ncbi:LysR family transcriptional regulator [Pseudoalteromonas sp. GB56]
MDKLRAIQVFRRVVELGSFTAAAQDLSLSKAAVSKNIAELEGFLRTPLINRTTRTLHITEHGQRYFEQIKSILENLNDAELSIQQSSTTLDGTIKVSLPMSFGLLLLHPIVCEFMALHPELSIEVVMGDSYLDLVDHGIDVAIRGGGLLKDSSLRSRKLIELERVVCAAPSYVESAPKLDSPQDLNAHNCLIYTLSSSPHRWIFYKDNQSLHVDIKAGAYAVNNGLAVKQAAVAGLGITLSPRSIVQSSLDNGELIELLTQWRPEKHALFAIYPFHKERSLRVRKFIDFMIERLDTDKTL